MKVFFVTVNHNQDQHLKGLIDDVVSSNASAELVCVNNGTEYFHCKPCSRVHVINVENHGYLHGLRVGVDFINDRGLATDADVVILCNPDVRLSSGFFYQVEKSIINNDNPVWIVAPDVEEQISGKSLNPNMNTKMSDLVFFLNKIEMYSYASFMFIRKLKGMIRYLKIRFTSGSKEKLYKREIFAPHGSFMITDISSLDKTKMLDHQIFLWGEEVCIAYSIRKHGGKVIFDPDIKVYHAEHSATSKIPSRRTFEIWRKSFEVYKYYLR